MTSNNDTPVYVANPSEVL